LNDTQGPVISYVGLGSNQGDRAALLTEALRKIDTANRVRVTALSSFYQTRPVGFTDQPDFLNAVAEISTTLTPSQLLEAILEIENEMGRTRTIRWGPRVIDIDILLYGLQVVSMPGLTIPHPQLTQRAFALAPLVEIAPEAHFPDGETAQKKLEILAKTGNNLGIQIVERPRTQ
jgi:2-amino-4-hydroxy-6-hydroxymethyldihydropteridine diphosphokinase